MELQYSLSITIFFIIFSLFWFVKQSRSSTKLPPGPWKLPVIGNLHNLALGGSLPHHTLRDLARKYGPLMHLKLGQVSQLIISSPKMAAEIMKTNDLCFAQRPQILAAQVLTFGGADIAFAPYGDYWRQMRKVCILELLSIKRVQSFSSIREDEVWNLIQSICSSSGPINFTQKFSSLSSSIVCRSAFGKRSKDEDEFISLTKEGISLASGFNLAEYFPSYKFLQIISKKVMNKSMKVHWKSNRILENIIHEHRQKQMIEQDGEEEDLVDVLLRLQQSCSLQFPITIENVKAVIWDIFGAAMESLTTTMEWAMAEMMKNPRVMEKAQAEVRNLCQGKKRLIHEKDIQKLSYLKLVIKETLRLHPPAPILFPRECREACKIDGYEIPLKTRVIVNAWAIGRDPEYWDDAESFIPERFEGSSIDYKGTDFEFIPFGAGRRICPGIAFATANMELPLANLLYHFNWKLPGGMKPENLDMTETFKNVVPRKHDLYLMATPLLLHHRE